MKFLCGLWTRIFSAALMTCYLVSCGGGNSQDSIQSLTYASAKQLWSDSEPSNYRFSLTVNRFRVSEGSITVIVQSGKVFGAFYTQTKASVSDDRLKTLPSLTGLFQLADEAYAKNAAQVDMTFNPTLGYLESLYIDFDKRVADEEVRYQVADFNK